MKANEDDKLKYSEEEILKKQLEYEEIIGFSQIINLIIDSKIPLVG